MSKQALRNLLRWGGLAVAAIGFFLGRTAQSLRALEIARVLMWVGLLMIVAGMIVRALMRPR